MHPLTALGDPTRRRIVELLAAGDLQAGQVAERFSVSRPAISQHLRVLVDARLARARVEGRHRVYGLDPTGLTEVDAWLAPVRKFWAERLDALADAIETDKEGTSP